MTINVSIRNDTNNIIESYQRGYLKQNKKPPAKARIIDKAIKKYCNPPLEFGDVQKITEDFVLSLMTARKMKIENVEVKIPAIAWILFNRPDIGIEILQKFEQSVKEV